MTSARVHRQYLEALGVDIWQSRAGGPQAPNRAVNTRTPQSDATVGEAEESVSALSPIQLGQRLPVLRVSTQVSQLKVSVLVVTDEEVTSDESVALLSAMFTAIDLGGDAWQLASFSSALQPTDGVALKELSQTLQPQAIVLMLRGNAVNANLDRLRSNQIRSKEMQSFAMVTYHPQDAIENPDIKRPVWEDLKLLRQWLSSSTIGP